MPSSESEHNPSLRGWRWWLSRLVPVAAFLAAGVLLLVLLGVAQRIGWLSSGGGGAAAVGEEAAVHTCPMHPQIRQPGPGRCPICGMALVPATSSGADLDQLAVRIEPAQRRLANIQTAEVVSKPVSTTIRTVGAIQIDESRQATIASYIDGRVERLFADYTGVVVQKGDHLAVVYSPQLYSDQVAYVEAKQTLQRTSSAALAAVRQAQQRLVENSRQRLVELGMTEEQLAELDRTNKPQSRLTIYTPLAGTVIEKLAEEGKYVSAGEPIYRIANLSTVWLMLELYPEDASRIRFGQVVEATLTSLPTETLIGRVAFIDPRVDPQNRTVGVRVEFKNDDRRLRPGDYAQATIRIPIGPQGAVYDEALAGKWISPMHPQVIADQPGDCPICGMKLVPTSRYGYVDEPTTQPTSVVAPRSAILMAGDHSVAYVETEPGRFELRNVKLGPVLRDEVIVLEGLKVGEKVATAGNFLIDSQMQLAGKPSLIDPTKHQSSGGAKPDYRNTPLQFDSIAVRPVGGEVGQQLEQLYTAYFQVQQALASDRSPQAADVENLKRLAAELPARLNNALPEDAQLTAAVDQQLKQIAENADHLHHLPIEKARLQFKPVSHAVVSLSTMIRGADAEQSFHHFFCPMVKQGEGDWLQPNDRLLNPYWGAEMLRCGELVRTIPPAEAATESAPQQTDANAERDE